MTIDPAKENLYLVGNTVGVNGVIEPLAITVTGSTLVLTPGTQVTSGSGAGAISVTTSIFTADSSTVSIYTDAGGVVGPAKSTAWPSSAFFGAPDCVVAGPLGQSFYVGYQVDSVVQAYSVSSAGVIQAPNLSNQQYTGNSAGPTALVLHPNNKFLYVANGDGSVQILTVSSGKLGAGTFTVNPIQASPGTNPVTLGIAINAAGTLLACANPDDSNSVVAFSVATNGALSAIKTSGTYKLAGSGPNAVVFNPSSDVIYVTNGGNSTLSALTVSSSTGLNPVAGSPFALPKGDLGPSLIVMK
jgi:hypothetical protein